MPTNGKTANVVVIDIDLIFKAKLQLAISTSISWKNSIGYEVKNLPSNGATANVHHDFKLHFQGHKMLNGNIFKAVRASEKCSSINFIEVDICH